jgi:hypothetical protein
MAREIKDSHTHKLIGITKIRKIKEKRKKDTHKLIDLLK